MLSIIVCVAKKYHVIGHQGEMCWHIPCDMAWFKFITDGKPVIMGRKTWESLPDKPLKNRKNIIFSRNKDFKAEGAEVICGKEEVMRFLKRKSINVKEYIIIGGAEIYELAFGLVDKIYYTEICDVGRPILGDTHFIEDCRPGWHVFDKRLGFCWQEISTKYDENLRMKVKFFVGTRRLIAFN